VWLSAAVVCPHAPVSQHMLSGHTLNCKPDGSNNARNSITAATIDAAAIAIRPQSCALLCLPSCCYPPSMDLCLEATSAAAVFCVHPDSPKLLLLYLCTRTRKALSGCRCTGSCTWTRKARMMAIWRCNRPGCVNQHLALTP
jgi:hypothetical protein